MIELQNKDAFTFLESLPDESVDLVITDPAYSGMNQHLQLGKGRIVGDYKNGESWFNEFHDSPENYGRLLSELKRVLKQNSHVYLMFDPYSLLTLAPIVREYFDVKSLITWDKVNIGMGHYFRRQTEFILFASKGKRRLTNRSTPDLWSIKRLHNAAYPTQKPVELFEKMIRSSVDSPSHEIVAIDPFLGSGSSAIAAIKTGISFRGCDSSLKAVELSQNRVDHFQKTGIDPLESGKLPEIGGETLRDAMGRGA